MTRNYITLNHIQSIHVKRRKSRLLVLLMFYLIVAIPSMGSAETNDFKEADSCRDALKRDPEQKKDRQNWERCIELYKGTPSFKEGRGRASHEIARLYQMLYFSVDQFSINDLIEAKKYYEMAIQQNRSDPSIASDVRKELDLLKPHLKPNVDLMPIDPDASPPLTYAITPRVSIGAKLNFSVRWRENRDLRDANKDDDTKIESTFSFAALYLPQRKIELFGEGRIEGQDRFSGDKEIRASRKIEARLRKAYLLRNDFLSPSIRLQVGRQKFKDLREWVYDENLDAIRLFYDRKRFKLELSVSTNLFDPEDLEDEIRNYIIYAVHPVWKKDKIAVYGVARRDGGGEALDLNFYGLEWQGGSIKNYNYWFQFGSVSGDEGPLKVRGHGFDLGLTYQVEVRWRPNFTFGYAFGSGDRDPDDGIDRSFRQTGLQDNESKFQGLTKIKYYGELFDPELSNIHVFTAGLGIRPVKKASLDLVYHYYLQVWTLRERANELRDSGIKEEPNGESRALGHELDLVFGMKITKNIKVGMTGAIFLPGDAYDESDPALLWKAEVRFLL